MWFLKNLEKEIQCGKVDTLNCLNFSFNPNPRIFFPLFSRESGRWGERNMDVRETPGLGSPTRAGESVGPHSNH